MHGQKLGINEPFLNKLVQLLEKSWKATIQKCLRNVTFIEKIVKSEEESFARTLHSGQHFAQGIVADLKKKDNLSLLVQMYLNFTTLMDSQLN